LQEALRPQQPLFPVPSEYPTVLSQQSILHSHCLIVDGQVVAHANLWPRSLVDEVTGEALAVGLIGNVATALPMRGRGLSRAILSHVEQIAKAEGMNALFLWSDLLEFYQNLGFASCGREYRHSFDAAALAGFVASSPIDCPPWQQIDESKALKLLKTRFRVRATLARSADEFRTLLSIPETYAFVMEGAKGVEGYAVLGKGYDMEGVVHEWGAKRPEDLLALARHAATALSLPELTILLPGTIGESWKAPMDRWASRSEAHPLALAKIIRPSAGLDEAIKRMFIWGLDSI